MLPDYPQFASQPTITHEVSYKWRKRAIALIEFVLILIMLQAILSLFQEHSSEEPIRYRILAHSDTTADQEVKARIQQEIEPMIAGAIARAATEAELLVELAKLEADMLTVAELNSPDRPVTLERKMALFPAKRSEFGIYPQDVYDAYILTIGSGRGTNWWCSIFPKVCYAEETEKESEEEVKFFVWEWITSWFA
ncbi:stage II sporulation protein R [Sporosarcina aquimarina]|uniref:Stage II sporulation protein R n=1 Tax=Sporosarcina aquimarina TaxID=114975 RepID=A0ABU4FWX8_9BACL|nr:stage II sporulation protein R [Sporosarcina aquimarina]MDW0108632.1 stage II sporulation protein R [Sporosarcina aquimarina]